MRSFSVLRWSGLLVLLVLQACTTGSKAPRTFALQETAQTPPDSLKAKAAFVAVNPDGSRETLSGVFFGVPGKRYRLELSGTMGVSVASLLWSQDAWTLVFPTEEQYLQGKGNRISVPGTVLTDVEVHLLAALFWGDLLPFSASEALEKTTDQGKMLQWEPRIGLVYRAFLDEKGWVKKVETWEDGKAPLQVKYGAPRELAGRWVPQSAQFLRSDTLFLEVIFKDMDDKATWGSGVWRLPVPKNYQRWSP